MGNRIVLNLKVQQGSEPRRGSTSLCMMTTLNHKPRLISIRHNTWKVDSASRIQDMESNHSQRLLPCCNHRTLGRRHTQYYRLSQSKQQPVALLGGTGRVHLRDFRPAALPEDREEPKQTDWIVGEPRKTIRQAVTESGHMLAPSQHQVQIINKCRKDRTLLELMAMTGRSDRTKLRHQVLNPLIEAG